MVPIPGAYEFVQRFHPAYRLIVVTSSRGEIADYHMKRMGVREKISAIMGYESTENHKPHPEPFIEGAKSTGIRPENFAAVDDWERGGEGARAAGMRWIAVPGEWTSDGDFSRADAVVKSLNDITIDLIRDIEKRRNGGDNQCHYQQG